MENLYKCKDIVCCDKYKTSQEWYDLIPKEFDVVIIDPDGWNRQDYEHSFTKEHITKEEFKIRLLYSTIICKHDFYTSEW